ncbi:MAG: type II toxin-antitoxin system VapC family toxin [Candidatus Hodarchaeales archaeon]
MVQTVVVDASIIVKWFITEKYSDLALKIREKFVDQKIQLYTPSLFFYETLNALKYSNMFSAEELQDARKSLENYGITQVPFNGEFAKRTLEIAHKYDVTIYDASYIALSDILDALAWSADKKLVEKVQSDFHDKFLYISNYKD